MRIAYILTSLKMGGAERQVLALAERMQARGHDVRVFVLRFREEGECRTQLPVVYLNMNRNSLSGIDGYLRAAHALREFGPDAIHGNNFHGNLLARLLKFACPSAAVVTVIHNIYEGGRLRMLAYRVTEPLSTRNVAVCQAAADRFVREGVMPRRKLSVISNGIDLAEFMPDAERRERVRAQLEAGDDFIWLAVGRVAPAKDYPNLLRAFAVASAAAPNARLWIAGEAQREHSLELAELCRQLKLTQTVRWLGLRRDIPALLDAADGFVLASAWEGMPLALGEAMAMEKRVVATDAGGVREMAGDCGTVVPVHDSAALARAMEAAMRKPAEERQMEQAARTRIAMHFNVETKAAEWESCYAAITRKHAAPPRIK